MRKSKTDGLKLATDFVYFRPARAEKRAEKVQKMRPFSMYGRQPGPSVTMRKSAWPTPAVSVTAARVSDAVPPGGREAPAAHLSQPAKSRRRMSGSSTSATDPR